jgi:glycosyltransferase involved in cell wall biosynthesis
MNKIKVILLTEIISPYRIPPFNYLAKEADIDLEIFFLAETESRRSWQVPKDKIEFSYRVLKGLQIGKAYQHSPIFLNPGVIYQLWQQKPDVIICGGWQHYTYWLALAYARITKTQFLIWSESTLKDERICSQFKDKLKRWIINQANGFIVPGKAQQDYLINLSANEKKIWIAPNAVDSDFFTLETELYRQHQEVWKEKLNLKGCVILFVGRLIDEKGIPELIEAFTLLSKDNVTLAIVGDGAYSQKYKNYCQQKKLENIIFTGFKSQDELVKYYAAADIFVFPTRSDPWGLVLNEAMAASLPIVCSAAAGAADDLIKDGGNGFIVPVGDVFSLYKALQRLIIDENLSKQMGLQSRLIINDYTPNKMAQGFKKAILRAFCVGDTYMLVNNGKFE